MTRKIGKNLNQRLFIVVLLVVLGFFLGTLAGRTKTYRLSVPGESGTENFDIDADFGLFWDTWETIREKYKDVDSVDDQSMVYGAASGLVGALGDPYSQFFEPENGKQFLDDISGSFEGIGAEIGIKDGILTIIAPLEGTPAKKAGLKSGDKIIQIDDEITMDMSIDEAVHKIRGERGTKVILTIMKDSGEREDVPVTRGVIKIPSIAWEILPGTDIAHVQLFSFTQDLSKDFDSIAQEILRSSAKKIIIDVRNNPGGYLQVSVDIAGWFLKEGDVVVSEGQGTDDDRQYKSSGPSTFKDWPIAVIINRGSASASEILAGALKDNLDSIIVGETSFGKGSVQEMVDIGSNAYVKLTVANWFTPNGTSISELGIEPDVVVEMSEEQIENEEDIFLEEAVKALE